MNDYLLQPNQRQGSTLDLVSSQLAVLESHKRTGEILALAKDLPSHVFSDLILLHDIAPWEADLYIHLYKQWDSVLLIVQHRRKQGKRLPTTPEDALRLVKPTLRMVS